MLVSLSLQRGMSVMDDIRNLKNIAVFQKRQIMKIHPLMYTYNLRQFLFHVTHQLEVGKPGGSSYVWSTVLKDAGKVLVERVVKAVTTDIQTRKAVKVPEWFQAKYSGQPKLNNLSEKLKSNLEIPKFPDDCYKWQTKIRYSDLDNNMHTNQSVYIKLCLDGATCAALTGKLRHFNADITWYPVEMLDITFVGESFPGDDITVSLRQDETDVSMLHFLITKEKSIITYADVKFSLPKIKTRTTASL